MKTKIAEEPAFTILTLAIVSGLISVCFGLEILERIYLPPDCIPEARNPAPAINPSRIKSPPFWRNPCIFFDVVTSYLGIEPSMTFEVGEKPLLGSSPPGVEITNSEWE